MTRLLTPLLNYGWLIVKDNELLHIGQTCLPILHMSWVGKVLCNTFCAFKSRHKHMGETLTLVLYAHICPPAISTKIKLIWQFRSIRITITRCIYLAARGRLHKSFFLNYVVLGVMFSFNSDKFRPFYTLRNQVFLGMLLPFLTQVEAIRSDDRHFVRAKPSKAILYKHFYHQSYFNFSWIVQSVYLKKNNNREIIFQM